MGKQKKLKKVNIKITFFWYIRTCNLSATWFYTFLEKGTSLVFYLKMEAADSFETSVTTKLHSATCRKTVELITVIHSRREPVLKI
jgi:hypothetical protein